ncbi:MarR family winged helix-turn-helix transcriptional regulator, partial [Halococcus hamelinensis]|uniref:MarR family winged helix-turn-helix transcriptional regulator n=1 Tax=Halococcus hamelinensis TaxID=332168 RepID=UPI00029AFF55
MLIKAGKAYRNQIREDLSDIGLYAGQEVLLYLLWKEDGLSQKELAARLEVKPQAISKMLDRMVSEGVVERRSDPNDSRISRVYSLMMVKHTKNPLKRFWSGLNPKCWRGFLLQKDRFSVECLSISV